MDYLKLFQTHEDYEDFVSGGTMVRPNVSHCVSENEVHYNPHTFADEYFTTIARENGTIDFTLFSWADTSYVETFAYSKNDGEWIETQNSDNREEDIVISVSVVEGDKVRWKGIANHIGKYNDNGGVFTSTCTFNAQGNIMSLLYGDDFKGKVTLENDKSFTNLFFDTHNDNNCLIINASDLALPATILTNYCYNGMFSGCTSLTTAPQLPATTLAIHCYNGMFNGCTSLITAPSLPATTLAQSCYDYMFKGCTSLVNAPELPTTTLVYGCYEGMFQNCTNLTTAPELPATTLAAFCYQGMFRGCISLTTAPVLPATTLANSCYNGMFDGCTNLTTVPELPSTTLANYCYSIMFRGCTSLTTAPGLPATTLVSGCYNNIFNGCTNLNYIKAMFTTTPSKSYTDNWVSGVASSGTFVKNSAATWTTTGVNGVPTGWTIQTASA